MKNCNQAIQADPNYAEAYLLLGLTEFRRGETAKSIEHYQRALKLQPGSYSGHYNLALAYLREHKLEEGRAQLEQAVKLDPNQADAAYDLGIVLLEQGQPSAGAGPSDPGQEAQSATAGCGFQHRPRRTRSRTGFRSASEAQAAANILGSDFQWSAAVGQLFLKNAAAEGCGCLSSRGQSDSSRRP